MAAQDRVLAQSQGRRSPLQAVRAWPPLWPYAPARPRGWSGVLQTFGGHLTRHLGFSRHRHRRLYDAQRHWLDRSRYYSGHRHDRANRTPRPAPPTLRTPQPLR